MECAWQTVVVFPKGNGKFRGISLVEVIWKALPWVMNRWIGASVQFHNLLHDFRAGWGTGTASLEAKFFIS